MINRLRTLMSKPPVNAGEKTEDANSIAVLQQKIEFYEAIINNLPNDLVVFDPQHTYVLINKSAIRDANLREYMLGKTDFDYCQYKNLAPSIAQQRREKFNYVIENKASYKWEESKKAGDKTEVISRTMRPVLNEIGETSYVLGYGMDISELRAAEALLQDMNRHLQEQVAERTRELTESNKSLERFAYSVSHDLRGPLRHIAAYSALLKKSITPANDTEQSEFLNYIITAVKKMEQQIDGLLKLSRISGEKPEKEHFNMQPVFTEALNIYKNYYEVVSMEGLIDADIEVMADRNLMSTVIENILSNSIKYSLPKSRIHLDVTYSLSDHEVIFSVRDKGIGFDMANYNKLFESFQRLHVRPDIDGLGIGLSHVKQIMDKHDGRIWAESVVDEGTVFHFALPR